MYIISLCDLSVSHPGGHTKFTFQLPSTHNTDYALELRDYLSELAALDEL
jgi:hypothetical protein